MSETNIKNIQWKPISEIINNSMGNYMYWLNPVDGNGSVHWSTRIGFFYGMKNGLPKFDDLDERCADRITHFMELPRSPYE